MRIISIVNRKGGVGKTTTALNLGAALRLLKKQVVLVDFDLAQANLSQNSEMNILKPRSETALESLIGNMHADFVLIDCPPSVGPSMSTALAVSTGVIVPCKLSSYDLSGLSLLWRNLQELNRRGFSFEAQVLFTFVQTAKWQVDIIERLRHEYSCFDTTIPYSRAIESAAGRSILDHAGKSPASMAYLALAKEVLNGKK